MARKTMFIINPNSNSGRTRENLERYQRIIQAHFNTAEFRFTEKRGHAKLLTRQALHEGAQLVVAVGGDGTANEVLNGFFLDHQTLAPDAHFAVIMCGTGCDFRRTLGWPIDFEAQVARIKMDQVKKIDVGFLKSTSEDGVELTRYFLNEASLGLSGEIAKRVWQKTGKKNKWAYFLESIASLQKHHPYNFQVKSEHGDRQLENVSFLTFANGAYFGGGMLIAPNADLGDGYAEVVSLAKVNYWLAISKVHRLYRGTHLNLKQVNHFRAKALVISEKDGRKVPIETDGEPCGFLPARFEIIPQVLWVRT